MHGQARQRSNVQNLARQEHCNLGYNYAAAPSDASTAQATSAWGGRNEASFIVPNGHSTDYIATTSPSYPLLCAMGQSSGFSQDNGNSSAFENLGHGFTGTNNSILPVHGHSFHQVVNSNTPSRQLSSGSFPPPQALPPSDDFTSDNIPSRREQIRTMMEASGQIPSGFTTQEIMQTPLRAPFPTPSQSSLTSYPTTDGHMSMHSFVMPSLVPSFQFPQGHFETPLPAHSFRTNPVGFLAFPESHAGSGMGLHTTDTINNRMIHIPSDRQYPTLPRHGAHSFDDHPAYFPDDYGAHGNFVEREAVGPRLQSSLPPDQHSLSPHELHSYDQVSRTQGGSQPQTPVRSPEERSVFHLNVPGIECRWRNDDGEICMAPIIPDDCAHHFSDVHGIRDMAWYFKVICRWCPSEPKKVVLRKNFVRHMREVHLHCSR
ncbi:hypothetical protein EDC04DRAFT_2597695 [Pisolithus marmoratus]|nr:hypothetical protein EDC04DRAFT_2597695 [Pisolithus marmoratus]